MSKFDELFKKLIGLKIIQETGGWEDNIPGDIWDKYFVENYKEIKSGIATDTYRWYETSIVVIEIYGELLGIRYISNMFSEAQDYEDCYHRIKFHKMKETKIISYECIKN